VVFLKLMEAKGIVSSLCESWMIPLIIFVCAPTEEAAIRRIINGNRVLYDFAGHISKSTAGSRISRLCGNAILGEFIKMYLEK
jgi:hypothetical protein